MIEFMSTLILIWYFFFILAWISYAISIYNFYCYNLMAIFTLWCKIDCHTSIFSVPMSHHKNMDKQVRIAICVSFVMQKRSKGGLRCLQNLPSFHVPALSSVENIQRAFMINCSADRYCKISFPWLIHEKNEIKMLSTANFNNQQEIPVVTIDFVINLTFWHFVIQLIWYWLQSKLLIRLNEKRT